ncbi:glycerophosphodiester phosphodiesterase family protein [Bifidobacterium eulemuris]|uniref:Glycerophosphodiester phosphodiesterase n=1 Tax=Bifidobacterium eulemuris TaxID=1765219 RepID=A0A261GCR3_9BIFI|nr:glycerophosphodiester phosphodiesterase family protein [Bifidobacterium eulemuris]OZG69212.1 glycerophosphodiester phosphodiesterase [Bifidobacterium eulemuris]QOL31278.1 glycerophosphoryl diester phosphodiesterase membrane domain-containing protein [Bifidobacterium eulemuris]
MAVVTARWADWASAHRLGYWAGHALAFEILYRLAVTLVLTPPCDLIVNWYADASLVSPMMDDLGILQAFLTIPGIILLGILAAIALVAGVFEITVMLTFARCLMENSRHNASFVYRYSIARLGNLRHPSSLLALPYYVFLVLLIHIGYSSSLLPTLEFPRYVIDEIAATLPGRIVGATAVCVAAFAYVALIFAPVSMSCEETSFAKACHDSVGRWKTLDMGRRLRIVGALLAITLCEMAARLVWTTPSVSVRDFNVYLLRYVVRSSYFREQLTATTIRWLVASAAAFAFGCLLVSMIRYTSAGVAQWNENAADAISSAISSPRRFAGRASMTDSGRTRVGRDTRWRVIISIIAIASLAVPVVAYLQQEPLSHEPLAIAHRGDSSAPENSLTGIQAAGARGADYVEIDVRLTGDGQVVVLHDKTTRRLAKHGENLAVAEHTLRQLQAVRLTSRGEDFRMPTLDQAIITAQNMTDGPGLLIELKTAGGQGQAERLADAVIETVERHHFADRAMFMSTNANAVDRLQQQRPRWWVGYCVFGALGNLNWQMDVDFVALKESQLNTMLLEHARDLHIPVYVWTVNDADTMRHDLRLGVCGIIADHASIIRTIIDESREADDIPRNQSSDINDDESLWWLYDEIVPRPRSSISA